MVNLEAIQEAASLLKGRIFRTPVVHSPTLSRTFGGSIFLKLENLQRTGSFKIRGATCKMAMAAEKIGSAGVVAASAGNHAQGVALAAKEAGFPATIVMPEWASISKQEATRGYGGEVILYGQSIEESLEKAHSLSQEGGVFIHPFDDPEIVAGQGTIGLEILEEVKDADLLIVPIGGGGLISGIAAAAKAIRPKIRVIGVQTGICPSAYESRRLGRRIEVSSGASIADGISVKQIGECNYSLIEKHVDEIVLVGEEGIAAALLMLLERKKVLSEGAGAVPLAALIEGKISISAAEKAVLVISGGNVDSPLLGRIINRGLLRNGRIMRVCVTLSDTPGSLAKLLGRVAQLKANVLHIYHDRNRENLPINSTCVELELETRSSNHIDALRRELQLSGYAIQTL